MKVLLKLVSVLATVLGAVLANFVFERLWKIVTGQDEAPDHTSTDYKTSTVLLAGVLQGAIAGGMKAAIGHLGMRGAHSVGAVPDDAPVSRH